MRPLEFPVPMHGVAITPKKRGDEQRISDVLHRMIAEDPTIVVEHDPTTNETVLRALGDLHLRSILERMARSTSSRSRRGRRAFRTARRSPRMPRASTATRSRRAVPASSARCRCGSSRSRAVRGFQFVDQTKGGVIPHQFMPAVQKGVEQVLATGAVAGFPLQDVRVVVHDGKHHPVDSKEVAFVAAGKKAFLDAIEKARPIVLEPIVSVEVICPEGNTGDIAGDLSSRRGQVTGTTRAAAGDHRDQRARPAGRARGLFGALQVGDGRARVVVDAAVALRAGAAQPAAAARHRIQEVAPAGRGLTGRRGAPAEGTRRANPARAAALPRGGGMQLGVFGATGGTGRALVAAALEHGWTVRAFVRTQAGASLPLPAGLAVDPRRSRRARGCSAARSAAATPSAARSARARAIRVASARRRRGGSSRRCGRPAFAGSSASPARRSATCRRTLSPSLRALAARGAPPASGAHGGSRTAGVAGHAEHARLDARQAAAARRCRADWQRPRRRGADGRTPVADRAARPGGIRFPRGDAGPLRQSARVRAQLSRGEALLDPGRARSISGTSGAARNSAQSRPFVRKSANCHAKANAATTSA